MPRWTPGFVSKLIAVLWCAIAGPLVFGADSPVAKEHQLKAAFTYQFVKFVEWPAGRFDDAASPLILGVTGSGPISVALQEAVKDRKINGRPLIVKVLETPEAATTVHVLFVTSDQDNRLGTWLTNLAGRGVLTVGETAAFVKGGGVLNFIPEGDKLRFEIDLDAVQRAGLKISAHLQGLAKSIRRKK